MSNTTIVHINEFDRPGFGEAIDFQDRVKITRDGVTTQVGMIEYLASPEFDYLGSPLQRASFLSGRVEVDTSGNSNVAWESDIRRFSPTFDAYVKGLDSMWGKS